MREWQPQLVGISHQTLSSFMLLGFSNLDAVLFFVVAHYALRRYHIEEL